MVHGRRRGRKDLAELELASYSLLSLCYLSLFKYATEIFMVHAVIGSQES